MVFYITDSSLHPNYCIAGMETYLDPVHFVVLKPHIYFIICAYSFFHGRYSYWWYTKIACILFLHINFINHIWKLILVSIPDHIKTLMRPCINVMTNEQFALVWVHRHAFPQWCCLCALVLSLCTGTRGCDCIHRPNILDVFLGRF